MGLKLVHVDASARFMGELAGVTDPEAKRKIIGREFVHVFQARRRSCRTPAGWRRARSTRT
jgi:GMP synthase (glutamine-hydrolysing)